MPLTVQAHDTWVRGISVLYSNCRTGFGEVYDYRALGLLGYQGTIEFHSTSRRLLFLIAQALKAFAPVEWKRMDAASPLHEGSKGATGPLWALG